ncbi:hypothetical protein GGF32_005247 [Allomyces javanicus]|nr:hypothetical protein GGF32_005247 [Allomyces javanicus]
MLIAHTFLLVAFQQKLRNGKKKAKNLAYLCSIETRHVEYMDALTQAITEDPLIVENPPLPPLDVALIWHSHMLSPIRYADDIQRRYGRTLARVDFPLLRLVRIFRVFPRIYEISLTDDEMIGLLSNQAKAHMDDHQEDLESTFVATAEMDLA